MESQYWIEKMLSTANYNSLSPEMIIEDNHNFANEIFSKFIAETPDTSENTTIDLLENYGKVNDDDVIPTIADEFLANFDSLLNQVTSTSPPEIFCLSSSPPTPIYHYSQQQSTTNEFNIYEFQHTQSTDRYFINSLNFDTDKIIGSISSDIKRELEVVDELVRAHSRHASDCEDNKFSPKSEYARSTTSSNCSTFGDDESSKVVKMKRGYRRNPEERKSRKKEQNKTAAIRYRQKKKKEIEVYLDEGKILAKKNRKLFKEYKETRREVKCLRSLMRELFQIRGFI